MSISLDRLQPGQTLEEWIPLNLANSVPSVGESGGGGADAGVGVSMSAAAAVRISITLNEDALLPVICYEPFLAAGLDNDMTFIKMINSQTASTAKIVRR